MPRSEDRDRKLRLSFVIRLPTLPGFDSDNEDTDGGNNRTISSKTKRRCFGLLGLILAVVGLVTVVLGGVMLATSSESTSTTWLPITVTGGIVLIAGIAFIIGTMLLRKEQRHANVDNGTVITNGRANISSIT